MHEKMNVIIVHGAYGHPQENWFGWLKDELDKMEIPCCVPQLPTPENQGLAQWLASFDQAVSSFINEKTVMIGHSLGAVFLLRWLEKNPLPLFSAILAGAFLGKVGRKNFDNINRSFFQKNFDWDIIKQRCLSFYCYYGTEDIYVRREEFDKISRCLHAQKIVVSKAGHFHEASGYIRFPHLLQLLKMFLYEKLEN